MIGDEQKKYLFKLLPDKDVWLAPHIRALHEKQKKLVSDIRDIEQRQHEVLYELRECYTGFERFENSKTPKRKKYCANLKIKICNLEHEASDIKTALTGLYELLESTVLQRDLALSLEYRKKILSKGLKKRC